MCETRSSVMCVRESEEARGISSATCGAAQWQSPYRTVRVSRQYEVAGTRLGKEIRMRTKTAEIPVSASTRPGEGRSRSHTRVRGLTSGQPRQPHTRQADPDGRAAPIIYKPNKYIARVRTPRPAHVRMRAAPRPRVRVHIGAWSRVMLAQHAPTAGP